MTVEQLRELVSIRDGYRIHWTCRGAEYGTAFVLSHKGRVVGAVVYFLDDPEGVPAETIGEAQEWWAEDRVPAMASILI